VKRALIVVACSGLCWLIYFIRAKSATSRSLIFVMQAVQHGGLMILPIIGPSDRDGGLHGTYWPIPWCGRND